MYIKVPCRSPPISNLIPELYRTTGTLAARRGGPPMLLALARGGGGGERECSRGRKKNPVRIRSLIIIHGNLSRTEGFVPCFLYKKRSQKCQNIPIQSQTSTRQDTAQGNLLPGYLQEGNKRNIKKRKRREQGKRDTRLTRKPPKIYSFLLVGGGGRNPQIGRPSSSNRKHPSHGP